MAGQSFLIGRCFVPQRLLWAACESSVSLTKNLDAVSGGTLERVPIGYPLGIPRLFWNYLEPVVGLRPTARTTSTV